MKRKNLFDLFVVISLLVLFAGCSDFFAGNFTTNLQFKINLKGLSFDSRSISREIQDAKISVELISQENFNTQKQEQYITDNSVASFLFKDIRVGSTIKITASIHFDDKEIYHGETDWLEVKPNNNLVSLTLEKNLDDPEIPDNPDLPDEPDAPEPPKTVTVFFDTGNGYFGELSGTVGNPLTPPENPTKPGYTFISWEPELPETFPEEDTTYKAKWTPNAYTVTFDANDGSSSMAFQTFTYDVEQALAENKFTRTGYTFDGWSTTSGSSAVQYNDKQSVKNLTAEPNGNITLYAQWIEKDAYKIEYVLDNGTQNPENPISYKESDGEIHLYAPTKTGYNFEGWFTEDGTPVTSIAADSTGDITLYANWTAVTYTIFYELNNGAFTSDYPSSYTIESEVTLVSPSKTGYTFDGWYTNANFTTKISVISAGSTEDITLYAKWTANENTAYTVKHYQQNSDNDDYSLVSSVEKTGTTNETTSAEANVYTGFTAKAFSQQTINADGTTVVEIYYDRNIITLTFDLAGGNGTTEISGKYGANLETPANPTKTGYIFAGWNPSLPSSFPEEDTTYTAQWNTNTVTNGGVDIGTIPEVQINIEESDNISFEFTLNNETIVPDSFDIKIYNRGELISTIDKNSDLISEEDNIYDFTLPAEWPTSENYQLVISCTYDGNKYSETYYIYGATSNE